MGLDITAYSKLKPCGSHESEPDECWNQGHIDIYAGGPNMVERLDGHKEGCYRAAEGSRELSFRAGSYSGYNAWRDELSELAQGRPAEEVWADPQGPFAELIYFSDCKGSIGPNTSAKLLLDFREFSAKARRQQDLFFMELYELWLRAFKLASDGGMVVFH